MRELHTAVFNLRGGGGGSTAFERLSAYLDWATNAASLLSTQISDADVARLVLTRGYESLLSTVGRFTGTSTERTLYSLLSLEVEQRITAFDKATHALDRQIERWSTTERFIVFDTSVFIHHPQKLEDLDVGALLGSRDESVRVLVPIVVVDELDGLKQVKDRKVRWRAGYTLAVIDRIFQRSIEPARLRSADWSPLASGGIPRGEVTLELLFDPPRHVRLPINDDEIIDRVLAVKPLAARRVTLVTYDTGQSMRARAAELDAMKLPMLASEEPES